MDAVPVTLGQEFAGYAAQIRLGARRVVARHPHETVVVVSHADPIKSAIAHYTGMHLDQFQRINVSPASVTAFDFHAYGVAMVKCNDTGGLDDLLPEDAPSSDGDKDRGERSSLAGVPSVSEAGIPPSSESDKGK